MTREWDNVPRGWAGRAVRMSSLAAGWHRQSLNHRLAITQPAVTRCHGMGSQFTVSIQAWCLSGELGSVWLWLLLSSLTAPDTCLGGKIPRRSQRVDLLRHRCVHVCIVCVCMCMSKHKHGNGTPGFCLVLSCTVSSRLVARHVSIVLYCLLQCTLTTYFYYVRVVHIIDVYMQVLLASYYALSTGMMHNNIFSPLVHSCFTHSIHIYIYIYKRNGEQKVSIHEDSERATQPLRLPLHRPGKPRFCIQYSTTTYNVIHKRVDHTREWISHSLYIVFKAIHINQNAIEVINLSIRSVLALIHFMS